MTVQLGDGPTRPAQVVSATLLRIVTSPSNTLGPVDVTLRLGAESRRVGEPFEYTPNLPDIDLQSPGSRGLNVTGTSGWETGHALTFVDFDGDGADDLAVGSVAPGGAMLVSIVRGGSEPFEPLEVFTPSSRVSVIDTGEFLPDPQVRLNNVGDVNGDGIADLAVAGTTSVAFLVFGRTELEPEVRLNDDVLAGRAVRLQAESGAATFYDVAFAPVGDVTGDGIADFAVGLANPPVETTGRVLLVDGRKDWADVVDLHEAAVTVLRGNTHAFGYELAVPGDTNGDGVLDLLACCDQLGASSRVYLIPLSAGLQGELAVDAFVPARGGAVIEREAREFVLTHSIHVAAAGDVDGSGQAAVLVSDEVGADNLRGITFVVPLPAILPGLISLPTKSPEPWDGLFRVLGSSEQVQSGRALAPAGDFNVDGFADMLVGEQNVAPLSPGNIFVVFGGPGLPRELQLRRPGRHAMWLAGTQPATRLDHSTPKPGDLNADGREDFAFSELGSPRFPLPVGGPSPGVVHVLYGLGSAVPFRRGDVNYDGEVNLSDAIFVLSFLFLGGAAPLCADAADCDDGGTIEITDAIRLLGFLFLGVEALPAPGPQASLDPTPDTLDCAGF